ncbi:MAG: hypothetical protein EBX66_03450 [Betaproteobacteria bacterium]|nr:hypothetical protein [Betaproteobacteria bacterium]
MPLGQAAHPEQALWCRRLSDDLSGVSLGPLDLGDPGPGEVRLRVRAAALNFPDLLMTRGLYQFKPELPFVMGLEGCGIVQAIGKDVHDFNPGDRVAFSCRHGAFASAVVLPSDAISQVPPSLDDAQAAAYAVTALTAWVSLVRRGRLLAGETLLVEDRARIRELLAQGVMLPPIGARFPMSDAVSALKAMAERRVLGKLCLEMPAP